MRRFVVSAAFSVGLFLTASAAQAAPATIPSLDTGIIAVSGGCGPGGFRARNGVCYPRRPPPPFRRRFCPPGLHLTPYGCRPNY